MAFCAKCGAEIPAGQEVRKGFLRKKSYHKECAPKDKVERLPMGEKKEVDWLRELCGDDAKLYDVLAVSLYWDPIAAISKEDLGILIEEAEKSDKDQNFEEAMRKYRLVLDKAIFEATQHQQERGRYIKVIQDLASKLAQATEKVKEKVEKEGLTDYVARLERGVADYKFVSERIEDVIEVASLYYNERLDILGEKERGEARREKRQEAREGERRSEKRSEERGEKRDKKREKERGEARLEEEREEKLGEKAEKERGEARREKILEERR
jgi:hypothetical protein